MQFSSVQEMVDYIKSKQSSVNREIAENMVDIMKEEVQTQVYSAYSPKIYERTNDMRDAPQIQYYDDNYAKVAFMMMGSWTSVSGSPFFPMYGLEGGTTWGRGGTNLMEVSCNRIENEIPNIFVSSMQNKGIPIR